MIHVTRKQFIQSVLLTAATVAGCKRSAYSATKVYGFQHHETTGVTSHIRVGEREQAIDFAGDSDVCALDRLYGLRTGVFLPLTDGKHLFVVGELSRVESWTPGGANGADTEPFRDFRLHDWYVVAPFEEWRNVPGDEPVQTIPRTALRTTDFDVRTTSTLPFDPRRYQKTPAEHRLCAARLAGR